MGEKHTVLNASILIVQKGRMPVAVNVRARHGDVAVGQVSLEIIHPRSMHIVQRGVTGNTLGESATIDRGVHGPDLVT